MFKVEEEEFIQEVTLAKELMERNYQIQINDRMTLDVFTNRGERVIDPDYELMVRNVNQNLQQDEIFYFVNKEGLVKFPMVGEVRIQGLTVREAEDSLENLYRSFYNEPYINLKVINRRVVVLGAPGGKVIPLENEDMNLIEVLALAGGLDKMAKAHNIRLIRGNLKEPEVFLIDLSTVEGMKRADMHIFPGDIIYVEPVRKIVSESIADIAPLVSLALSVLTLIVLIQTLP
jgi:polysaccharide export outer membrane protein